MFHVLQATIQILQGRLGCAKAVLLGNTLVHRLTAVPTALMWAATALQDPVVKPFVLQALIALILPPLHLVALGHTL